MNALEKNLHLIPELKNIVKNGNGKYYEHIKINDNPITENTISIVMTSHERSKQVYFTLHTIQNSSIKDIQIILVDDSENDKVDINELSKYNFNIDFIQIIREKKIWRNPCINYNIGFEYIKGGKVIIQNSEVCHIGDVLLYINNNVIDDNYYVFDVRSSTGFEQNEIIYNNPKKLDINFLNKFPLGSWYQHQIHRNKCFHFLTAVTINSFNKINGFSYDYSFGSWYDDDDILIKIRNKLSIINVNNDINNIGGIHLFHGYEKYTDNTNPYKIERNDILFLKKLEFYNKTKIYLEISEGKDLDEIKIRYDIFKSI